jgi:hypothetical protein
VNNASGGELISKKENKMTLDEYFSDCEALVSKLKNKEFKRDKYIEAVKFYNKSCGQ